MTARVGDVVIFRSRSPGIVRQWGRTCSASGFSPVAPRTVADEQDGMIRLSGDSEETWWDASRFVVEYQGAQPQAATLDCDDCDLPPSAAVPAAEAELDSLDKDANWNPAYRSDEPELDSPPFVPVPPDRRGVSQRRCACGRLNCTPCAWSNGYPEEYRSRGRDADDDSGLLHDRIVPPSGKLIHASPIKPRKTAEPVVQRVTIYSSAGHACWGGTLEEWAKVAPGFKCQDFLCEDVDPEDNDIMMMPTRATSSSTKANTRDARIAELEAVVARGREECTRLQRALGAKQIDRWWDTYNAALTGYTSRDTQDPSGSATFFADAAHGPLKGGE